MLIVAVLASAAAPANALGATITVDTTADAEAVDGLCSLREAIRAANTDTAPSSRAGECAAGSGADTIMLPAGTYKLTVTGPAEDNDASGDLDVRGPTTLDGAGAGSTTIDASAAHDRALQILAGATATIQGVTITGGHAPDGANGASHLGAPGDPAAGDAGGDGQSGGGILNDGTLSIVDSVIAHNSAGAGAAGGAGTGGAVADTSGASGGNGTGGAGGDGGSGGGLFSDGVALTLTRTAISNNAAGDGGAGGDGSGGEGGPVITGVGGSGGDGFAGRGGSGGAGGGLVQLPSGSLKLLESSVTGNVAGDGGRGGVAQGGIGGGSGGHDGGAGGEAFGRPGGAGGNGGGIEGVVIATDSLISGNTAGSGARAGDAIGGVGGAATGSMAFGGTGGSVIGAAGGAGGLGGGIDAIIVSGANVTIVGDSAGAGGAGGAATGGDGGAVISGTIGAGGAAQGGDGGHGGSGGGLSIVGTGSSLVHATISGNRTFQGGAEGIAHAGGTVGHTGFKMNGSAGAAGIGGAATATALVTVQNSIINDNDLPSCFGEFIGGAHDLMFPDDTCLGTVVSPRLEPLADNGGSTQTEALAAGSPALDAVPGAGAGCPATDQRGVTRPHGTACDIGAYEHAGPDVSTDAATSVTGGGATLKGSVTPNGVQASYHFEYGKTTAYDSATIARTASGGASAASAVTAALTGLAPGTTYHYRLVATNADGTTPGADRTVTTTATASTGGTPPGGQPPRFLSASVNPRVFAVKPTTSARRKRARSHAPFGTTFRFTLSEAARVTFTIERALPGRTSGRVCRAPTRQNRARHRCTRFVTPRVFVVNASAGQHATKFDGHIGRTALAPGSYRATLIATDAAKRRSAPKRLTFRIVPT